MYCEYCGAKLVDGSRFCMGCGARLGEGVQAAAHPQATQPQATPTQPTQAMPMPAAQYYQQPVQPAQPAVGAIPAQASTAFKKKTGAIIAIVAIVIVALLGAGMAIALGGGLLFNKSLPKTVQEPTSVDTPVTSPDEPDEPKDEPEDGPEVSGVVITQVSFDIEAQDYVEGSRVPIHVEGTADSGKKYNEIAYFSIPAKSDEYFELEDGSYTIALLASPISGDGHIYEYDVTSYEVTLTAGADGADSATTALPLELMSVDPAYVTDEDIEDAYQWVLKDDECADIADDLREAAYELRDRSGSNQTGPASSPSVDESDHFLETEWFYVDLPEIWEGNLTYEYKGDNEWYFSGGLRDAQGNGGGSASIKVYDGNGYPKGYEVEYGIETLIGYSRDADGNYVGVFAKDIAGGTIFDLFGFGGDYPTITVKNPV